MRTLAAAVALLVVASACGNQREAPRDRERGEQTVPSVMRDAGGPPGDGVTGFGGARRSEGATEIAPIQVPETAPARRLWSAQLKDAATFEAYSKELGGERFTKFVIDLRTNAIHYFDVNVYPVHKDFVFAELYKKPKTKAAIREFDRNYGPDKPEFLLCYIVHHVAQDLWTFAFWDGDRATAAHIRQAYRGIGATFLHADRVKYRPDSNEQEAIAKTLGDVPFVLNDQIYKAAEYQVFNEGVAVGTLRIVPPDSTDTELTFTPEDIVVLPTPLSDITPVAGIIAEQFSSPLSHMSLRAKGWGVPNIGLRGASEKLSALAGTPVYFEAKHSGHRIRPATEDEVAAFRAQRATRPVVVMPAPDLESRDLEPLSTMTADDDRRYGPKASNLGVIIGAKLPGFQVPPGFGVPFAWYKAHARAAGIDEMIDDLVKDAVGGSDLEVRGKQLAAVRMGIEAQLMDPELCAKIEAALGTLPADRGVFVRSSHNAEDMATFSGAGLHDTVPNVKGAKAVCAAVKHVWASAWKQSAFEARHFAGIDQRLVAAGALVQTGVAATAAGVMVTVHPTDPTDERNYTINAKSGLGMAVVDGRKIPESLMVSWYNHGIRVLSRSDETLLLVFDDKGGTREVPNPNQGKPVLTNKMAIRLADTGRRLTKLFSNKKLDVEWLFVENELYIVQTRPLVGQ